MSRSGQVEATVDRFVMPSGTLFRTHRHDVHQLAWAATGILVVECAHGRWVLPPTRALWIPSGIPHATACAGAAVMESLYVQPDACPVTWAEPTVVAATPLLTALLGHLGRTGRPVAERDRAMAVLYDTLRPADTGAVHAPLPAEPRARRVAAALRADPGDRRDLEAWAATVHTSGRTLARTFRTDTGLTFGQWRTATRVQAALLMLAANEPVSRIAGRVGYDTTSAFVAAFRRFTGTTPGSYFSAEVT